MVAPHCHTAAEAKASIRRVEHNRDNTGGSGMGAPTGIAGGSASNKKNEVSGVSSKEKGGDWVSKRGIKSAT
jgi:hypothetical protein